MRRSKEALEKKVEEICRRPRKTIPPRTCRQSPSPSNEGQQQAWNRPPNKYDRERDKAVKETMRDHRREVRQRGEPGQMAGGPAAAHPAADAGADRLRRPPRPGSARASRKNACDRAARDGPRRHPPVCLTLPSKERSMNQSTKSAIFIGVAAVAALAAWLSRPTLPGQRRATSAASCSTPTSTRQGRQPGDRRVSTKTTSTCGPSRSPRSSKGQGPLVDPLPRRLSGRRPKPVGRSGHRPLRAEDPRRGQRQPRRSRTLRRASIRRPRTSGRAAPAWAPA